jgi:hypothetical protein
MYLDCQLLITQTIGSIPCYLGCRDASFSNRSVSNPLKRPDRWREEVFAASRRYKMVHIDRCFRRVDEHGPTRRLSYDGVHSGGAGAGWIRWKISTIYPEALNEFKLVFNVALITVEKQATIGLGARGFMCGEWRAIGNTSTEEPPFLRTAFTILGTRGSNLVSWVGFPNMACQRTECAVWVEAVEKRICRVRRADLRSQIAAGLRADPGTQARIACSSGPTPMIAITRLML